MVSGFRFYTTGPLGRIEGLDFLAVKPCDTKELDQINVSIAKAAVTGKLDANPVLQGIIVQCMRHLDKGERGVLTVGRKPLCTVTEEHLVTNAAFTFALAGANRELATQLGQNLRPPSLNVEKLHEFSLPNPMLALKQSLNDRLELNTELADQFFPRKSEVARRLVLALDHTYLQRGFAQAKLGDRAGLVGGCWHPDLDEKEENDRSFMDLTKLPDKALKSQKAPLMLEALVWDPTSVQRNRPLSLASMPMSLKASDADGSISNHGKRVSWRHIGPRIF